MLIDCFTFYNELELLTYRLNTLINVDYFVIVESTRTHVGTEKRLFYNENKHLFEDFKDRIIHVIVNDMPHIYPNINVGNHEQWKNENHQRNCIIRGLNQINLNDSDLIMISDLDEIPDRDTLHKIKNNEIIVDFHSLRQSLYYYNLNTKFNEDWSSFKIITYKCFKNYNLSCNDIRAQTRPVIQQGGWHMSYFGDDVFIKNKLETFGHQEYNNAEYTDNDKIKNRMNGSVDLFGRNMAISQIAIQDNTYLPHEYNTYLSRFCKF